MSPHNKRITILIDTKDCSDTEGHKNQTNFVAQKMAASEALSARCINRTLTFKGHTQMASNHVSRLVFLFSKFEFLWYKTNRLHFSVRVYCNRSQKTSQRVKNNSHTTRLRLVSYFFVLYTL